MNIVAHTRNPRTGFELRFPSLFVEGRGLAFPCDDHGRVDIDELPERARSNYFYARTLIGREFATPKLLVSCPVDELH